MVTACPKCGYSNNGIDVKCASCGCPLPETDGPARRHLRFSFSVLHVGAFALVLAFGAYMIWGAGNWTKPENVDLSPPEQADPALANEDNSAEAWIIMCDFMREKVRTPGNAAFPALGAARTHAVKKTGTTYEVRGYVDYEGDANAIVRRYFRGEVTQLQFASWKLDSYEMESWDKMEQYFAD